MLSFEFKNYTGSKQIMRSWHYGDSKPTFELNEVISVQADGDELEYIKLMFTNIPMVKRSVARWTGEIAQFIYDNL